MYTLVCIYESSEDLVKQVVSKKIYSSITCDMSNYSKIVRYYCILCNSGGNLINNTGN